MNWTLVISFATTLVLLLNPLGNAPVVTSLLQDATPERRRAIILRELVFALILLLIFFMAGKTIMNCLHISRTSLNIAGGLLLFLVAIGMVFPPLNVLSKGSGDSQKVNVDEVFIVPLAVPILAGPGALSIVMLKGSGCESWGEIALSLIAIIIAWGITVLGLLFSQKLLNMLGEKGSLAIMRLMGMLLVLLAVEMFLGGIEDFRMRSLPTASPAAAHG